VCVCVCVFRLNKTGPCSASLPAFPNENSDFQSDAEDIWRKAQEEEHNVHVCVSVPAGAHELEERTHKNWKNERTYHGVNVGSCE
jgi:hypothetical protein